MTKCRVALVAPHEAELRLRGVLRDVEVCSENDTPDVRIVWMHNATALAGVSTRASFDPKRTFYLLDVTSFAEFSQLFDRVQLHHLRGTRDNDLATLARDIEWARTAYLPGGLELIAEPSIKGWSLQSSAEIEPLLQELGGALAFDSVNPRIVAQFVDAAAELLTNALYNAPVDHLGDPLFRFRARDKAVTLPNQDSISVQLCRSETRFLLSIRDPYGSLTAARIVESLRRAHHRNERQVQPTPGGAGVGMMVALNNLSSLVFCLHAGVSSEVIAGTDIVPSFREFQQLPRAFSLWSR